MKGLTVPRCAHGLLATMIAASIGLAAAGCGGSGSEPSGRGGAGDDAKPVRVAVVTSSPDLNDRSFNQLANEGLKRAEAQLAVEGRIITSRSNADFIPNLKAAATQGNDVVIAVGFEFAEPLGKVAPRFPRTRFVLLDSSQTIVPGKPRNVEGILFEDKQSGYLAGYLAGLLVKERGPRTNGKHVVASVGGEKIPPVDSYIAGFNAGAKAADPAITTLYRYSQTFTDPAACKEIALDQIAHGANVILAAAGGCGLGALDAAKEKGVWAIETGANLNELGSHMLSSALKETGVTIVAIAKGVKAGTFRTGGDQNFDVASGGVGLGPISKEVPPAIVKRVDQLHARMAAGQVPAIPGV
jgi:basic membrane protein A and related proteins